jgi:hypothetical protein
VRASDVGIICASGVVIAAGLMHGGELSSAEQT